MNISDYTVIKPDELDYYQLHKYQIEFCSISPNGDVSKRSNIDKALLLVYFQGWHKTNVKKIIESKEEFNEQNLSIRVRHEDIRNGLSVDWSKGKLQDLLQYLIDRNAIRKVSFRLPSNQNAFLFQAQTLNEFVMKNYTKLRSENIESYVKYLEEKGMVVLRRDQYDRLVNTPKKKLGDEKRKEGYVTIEEMAYAK